MRHQLWNLFCLFWLYNSWEKGECTRCRGCRARKSLCAFIKKGCKRIAEKNPVEFCFECSDFACENLVKMDTVYRKRFNISLIENLNYIKEKGIDAHFLNLKRKNGHVLTVGK